MYAIVHESYIYKAKRTIELKGNETAKHLDPEQIDNVLREIQRIKREEIHVVIEGEFSHIGYEVPKGTTVRVCGAYGQFCVKGHMDALKEKNIPCELHREGTLMVIDEDGSDYISEDNIAF